MTRSTTSHTTVATAAVLVALVLVQPLSHGQGGAPLPGYPPVLRDVQLAFPTRVGNPFRPVEDYLQIINLPRTSPLHPGPTWTFYARVEPMIHDSAQRLWLSGLFHSVWVDVMEDPFPNGAEAKRVVFNVVERVQPGPAPVHLPEPPPGYEHPPPSHERIYPPPGRR